MSTGRVVRKEAEKREIERDMLMKCLQEMLREEDNRYCVDCDAKGPRWAAWNIGIFLCIRCAGIHRKLGSHLSKVKSVNLDSWTPEQVQSMRAMGNCKARGVYECGLPEHFRRPASDQSLEQFVRAKYEAKRYVMRDWAPPKIDPADLPIWGDLEQLWKHGVVRSKTAGALASATKPAAAPGVAAGRLPAPQLVGRDRPKSPNNTAAQGDKKVEAAVARQPSNDLLGLDLGNQQQAAASLSPQPAPSSAVDDLLALGFGSAPPPAGMDKVNSTPNFAHFAGNNNAPFDAFGAPSGAAAAVNANSAAAPQRTSADDPFGAFVGAAATAGQAAPTGTAGVKATSTQEIMALYGAQQQQQHAAVRMPIVPQQQQAMHAGHRMAPMAAGGVGMGVWGAPVPAAAAAGQQAQCALPPQLAGFQSAPPAAAIQQQHYQQQRQQQQPNAIAGGRVPPVADAFAGLNMGSVWQQGGGVGVPRAQQQQPQPRCNNDVSLW